MIYDKDHTIEKKNEEAPTDVVEEIKRIKINNKARWENLNVKDVRDDVDGSVSFSHAPWAHPKTSNSSSNRRRKMKILKTLKNLKS